MQVLIPRSQAILASCYTEQLSYEWMGALPPKLYPVLFIRPCFVTPEVCSVWAPNTHKDSSTLDNAPVNVLFLSLFSLYLLAGEWELQRGSCQRTQWACFHLKCMRQGFSFCCLVLRFNFNILSVLCVTIIPHQLMQWRIFPSIAAVQ